MLTVFKVTQSFLFKVPIYKKTLDVSELGEEAFKLFIVVFFDTSNFFTHTPEFCDLIFNFILELSYFSR